VTGLLRRTLRLGPVILFTRPAEFVDRLLGFVDRLTDRFEMPATAPLTPEALWPTLSLALGTDVSPFLREPALAEVDALVEGKIRDLPTNAPFGVGNSAEKVLGRAGYVICRALHPDTVVETGVAYGSMSTYLLTALALNNHGMLHSVDLPSVLDRRAEFVGRFVPDQLRNRWSLHLGASRRVLPKVLRAVGPVGLFVHDSLHTRRNMSREFATVAPHLASSAAVLSDDVHWNRAFEDWARTTTTHWALVRQVERDGWLGVAILQRQEPRSPRPHS